MVINQVSHKNACKVAGVFNAISRWLCQKRKPQRKVMLVMYDNQMVIAKAYPTQAGYIARWVNNDRAWSLLLPGGKVDGTNLVKRWMPHSGWNEMDYEFFDWEKSIEKIEG